MPKDFTAPSQNWNVQDQINQSKKINQENNSFLDTYKKQTDAYKNIDSILSDYENQGIDTSGYRKKLEEKANSMDLSFGDKLGTIGRNIGNDYVSSFSKAFGGNLENSYSQKLDEAKQNREEVINPVSTIASEVALDPLTYTPLNFASKGTKAVRMAKDFGKGAGLSAGLYTAKEYGDDNYKASDSAIAGAFGGGLNALLGRVLNRKVAGDLTNPDATSGDNILSRNPNAKTYKSGNAIEPNDQVNININQTQQPLTQDELAARLNESLFGNKQQDKIPVNNQPTYDPFRGDFPLNKTTETKAAQQTTDPFTWQPKQQEPKATDTFGFAKDAQRNASLEELRSKIEPLNKVLQQKEHMQNMNMDRVDNSPYIFKNDTQPISKLPDTLPFNDKEEMKSIIRYAKDNDAVDEFISKLPQNARVDEVQKFFDNLKPTQIKEDGIIPVTTNKKEPIKNYNISNLQEFEGLTKATGNNTADVLSLSTPTSTSGVRNAIERYIGGTSSQRDIEILDAVDNFMKNEGDNFRQKVGVSKPDTSMKIDDAIRNNIDYKTADANGVIPFSNGTQTFGGASVGGLESEFNQRDYNNDGKHDYKDNIYGAIIGALGINAAKKLFPKAFKDGNIDKNTNGMFVGARPDEQGAFSDIATKKVMREIDDSGASLNKYQQDVNSAIDDVVFEKSINGETAKAREIKNFAEQLRGKSNDEAEKIFNQKFDDLTKLDIKDREKLFDEIDAIGHIVRRAKARPNGKLSDYLDHKELFDKYPELKDYTVQWKFDSFDGGAKGSYSAKNDWHGDIIKIDANRPNEEIKSTLLHEIQHAIQDKEGWAKGGNPDMFKKTPLDLKKGEYSSYILNEAKNSGRNIKDIIKELKDDALNANIEDNFYKADDIEVILQLSKSNTPDKLLNEWQQKYITPDDAYGKYKSLWGEQQARATQQRMNMTPEQRASEDWTQTLAKNEGKYNEPIIKYDSNVAMSVDENANNFLRKARERIQAKIDSGEIPEKGRTVISPYDKGKEYYLGESGKVYFKRGNGTWRETPNEETIKDVKYVATNGLSAFKKMRGEENLRFEKALEESKKFEEARNNTYKMDHKAPTKENGVSADDITEMFSKDIYSKDAARLFGHGATKMDNESISLINKVRNKPEAEVTIYRAVPKDLDVNINPDDWVTTSKEYAKVHGEGPLKGNYKILEMKVKAKDLYTDGNSIHEWGWSPNTTPDGMIAMSSPTLSGTLVGGVTGAISDLDGDGKITYKDIAIGALGGAGLTKGALLAKNTNIANKAKNIIKNIADTETADKIFGHKIYQKTDYMNLREAMIVSKNKQMESFALLHEQLKLLDDATRTKMYNYMSGDRSIQLDTNIKQLADNYINEIDRMGKELVDLGVLEEAQFDKFKGRYLHRRYEKDLSQKFNSLFTKGKTVQGVYARGNEWNGTKDEYERLLANGEIGDFFSGKIEATRMNNGQYKFRQDWTDEQRARWGEIKDIAFSLPETLMRTREMIDHAKMLKNIVDNTGYVSNDALEGYVQLSGKRYGALNGKYVPSDIASDIKEFGDALFGAEGKLLSSKGMEAFKALSTFWKKSHTVYNPIAHLNNLLSNVTMQFGAGINPNKAVINATKGAMASQKVNQFRELTAKKIIGLTAEENTALRALSQDEDLKLWNQAQQAGLFGRSNLNDILNKYVNPTNAQVSSNKFKNAFQKVDEATSSWYQGEDNIMRFSMLKSLTESGASFDDAIKQINNTIPDYTKPMSQWARFGRDSMLTPFISWTYYATPIILKQMKDKPERIAAIYGALYGMNQLMGIDPFNEKDIPQQNFSMKRIPIYKNGNEVTTIKVDRWIPHNDILNPLDFIKNLTSGGAWTPISDIPRNRNSYFGGKITHNEGALKAYDLTKYGIQQITPDALDNIYNLIESKVMSEKKRTKNPVIKPRTTTEELLKNIGLNIMTYNKSNQARKVANEKIK